MLKGLVTFGALAGLGYLGYRAWEKKPPESAGESPPESPPAPPQSPPAIPYMPPAEGDARWGLVPARAQRLLRRAETVTGIPGLAVFLAVVGQGEGNWKYLKDRPSWDSRNTRANETAASIRAYDSGVNQGRPVPGAGSAVRTFGSGGAFGSLAPYVAWAGFNEGKMPLLNSPPSVIFDPATSTAHAAYMASRLVREPYSPATWAQLRLAFASPNALLTAPEGALAADVLRRMLVDVKDAGLVAAAAELPKQPVRNAGERSFEKILAALKEVA